MADEKALNVRVPSDLKNKFTRESRNAYGEEPGAVKKATIEAIKLWLKEKGVEYKE